ncbi:MAG: Lon protease [Candidatus Amesbacteria bacterium GW2011_GWA1_47_16]|uniref:Lon protease n=3 Tax=Candidatus Amesiibacteriota TaxID=1752730 RepID=A0A0G1UU31_9BACT|nr:MAG: Lon protease [Candidatus Amesbacteria bacterium GW2011_GWA1_47_16]KKU97724.1 MAG: Lon protease [Candidatus Amesbacteria bacterium GW2011_GWB1_48_13]OGC98064.1 MAG: endopeptidase La [Candidatus Amesbacteria bacterium RIFCSPHIGHO2_01_FULL_47_34]OGC99593.1 MAG: endopeptidase La [Candidatus Amesbacteria bacterium RIFCSPLOWO2_01_FULL_47_33]
MAFSLSRPNNPAPETSPHTYPVVALREGVVFPHTEAHLTFGRPKSNSAIEAAIRSDKHVVFIAQKTSTVNPAPEDLYQTGTLCVVEQVAPYGQEILALVRGINRVKLGPIVSEDPHFVAQVETLPEQYVENDKLVALARQAITEFKNAFNLGKSVEFPVFMRLMSGVSAPELADQIANSLEVSTEVKQELLETADAGVRLEKVLQHLVHEIKVLELEKTISSKTHAKFEKNMREQVLRERKKTIQEELQKLGAEGTEDDDDIALLKKRIKAAKMPVTVRQKAEKELVRLSQMSQHNPESNYIHSYLDWLVDMPWSVSSTSQVSIQNADKVLDEDHYGLKKAKERILEHLAVMKLKSKLSTNSESGPTILCFVGPPGVGKTSIGKSIARALGRKFVRVSLGGVRDEAEIRGHRRTYVGSMPGRIIQGIKNAGTKNPIFMLDEIDKLASDYRGDPSAALLEALDPEQNREFSDHYLEVAFDLSQVMFITTANMLDTIPPALRDRLEVITFAGYTLDEKYHIAKDYLWPKQLRNTGLDVSYQMPEAALKEVIQRYTREAGVRDLERNLAKICRKLARNIAEKKKISKSVSIIDIRRFLGPARFPETLAEKKDEIGMSTGLAWTEAGGDILFIEVALMPGKGDVQLTGQLGEVMKESAKAAYSYVRSRWKALGLKESFYKKLDIHIHVPEGAVPKDGPSAGIAIATAIVSALTHVPSRRDVAMTGEITLRGRVLEIGGVKEKVIAAHRAGIKQVIMPRENRKDLEDVPGSVKRDLKFHYASHLDEVLKIALRLPSVDKRIPSRRPSSAAYPIPA